VYIYQSTFLLISFSDTCVTSGACTRFDLAVLQMLENNVLFNVPHQSLLAIAETVEHSMGGCSGAVS